MKKIILLIFLTYMTTCLVKAQQDPHYCHFMFLQPSYNPAYCGTEGMINAVAVNRTQWAGMTGSPNTTTLSVDAPVNFLGTHSGVGLTISNDVVGYEKNFLAKFAYAYHINVGTGLLSIGVDAGLYNKTIDGDWQFPDEPESIFGGKTRKMVFDLGAGLLYKVENLTLGFSSVHALEPEIDFSEDGKTYLARHYYFTGAYNIPLANALLDLTPNVIAMSDGNTLQFDININILYNKKILGGVTYRNKDAIALLAGLTIMNDFRVGLAYELGVSKLRKTNIGSFEVMLGYAFMPERSKPAQKSRSVRFL